jgi:hypothetical protein
MSSALTYNPTPNLGDPLNLWQLVQDYTANTEVIFVSYIPTFIQLAEERISNDVQIPPLRKSVVGPTTISFQYISTPSDYLAPFSVATYDLTGSFQTFLLQKDVEYIRQAFPYPSVTGIPTHYAQFDYQTFILGPTPDQIYNIELHYYAYPISLVDSGTTPTWVSTNAANALLYGTLREAYIYMKGEPDMIANYEAKYQEGITLLRGLAEGKGRRDAYRSGQVRTVPP